MYGFVVFQQCPKKRGRAVSLFQCATHTTCHCVFVVTSEIDGMVEIRIHYMLFELSDFTVFPSENEVSQFWKVLANATC